MAEPRMKIKADVGITARRFASKEDPYLVAALAATLVEYRRYVKQRNGNTKSEATGHNWRIASRLEQLQG